MDCDIVEPEQQQTDEIETACCRENQSHIHLPRAHGSMALPQAYFGGPRFPTHPVWLYFHPSMVELATAVADR